MSLFAPRQVRIGLFFVALVAMAIPAMAQMEFHTVAPCRIYDSRGGGGGPLNMWDQVPANEAAATYTVAVTGKCGVPADAVGVFVNLTILGASKDGFLEVFPGGMAPPATSSPLDALFFMQGRTQGKFEVARLSIGSGELGFRATVQPIPPPPGARIYQVTLDVQGFYLSLPIAVDDVYDADINTTLNVNAASGVTANDTLNGSVIASYGAITGAEQTTLGTVTATAQGGSVKLNADGSFSYVPPSATFKGDDTFKYILQNSAGSSTADVTISVSKLDQTISFTSTPPVGATVGGPTYTVAATATSSLPVTFTIDPSASTVCSIAGSTVSFIGIGTCRINADQAGDATYNAAPQAQQSFPVGQGSQTISFTSTAPVGATVNGPTYTVTATASPSGLPVTFTIDATASSVCTIAGSTVSFIGVGNCVINANQPGDANYSAAPQAQQPFAVGQGSQTITFTSPAPVGAKVGGPTYTVTATASPSGLPVTFTIDATASSVCTIAGSTVSFIGVGTCVINANQAGDANYSPAPQVQQPVAVGQGSQTITFTSPAPVGAKVGGPTYTVTATASPSGLPVTFTIDASSSSVCTIAGSTVSFIGVGTCVINANQAGDANYGPAPQVQQPVPVAKGDQTISFTSAAPVGAKVGGPTYTVTATASPSGLPVTFAIDASSSSVCTIAGSAVSFIGVGTCLINANQAGNADYNPAPQVQQPVPVAKGDQTISFTSTAPVGAKVGGPTYTVTATASPSGLPVTFTIDASASSVCTIAGSTVSFVGAGTCLINANQAGNANYNPAPQVQQPVLVAKGDQTISFTSTAPVGAKVGGPTYTVTATASPSSLPVTFTIDASATSVCTIAGSTVSFIGAGTCLINANQAGNADYNAAPQVQQPVPVAKGDQTITFTSTAPTNARVGGPTYTVMATASPSGLPVTFTIAASASSVCTVAGSTVSFIGAGTCVINANQAGNANYNPALQVQQSFQVFQAPQITSTNTTSFTAGLPGTFTVTTIGFPTNASMSITESGALPSGVTFTNNNNGTATLAGTPAAGTQTGSPYVITITADNGIAPAATQTFTLNILNTAPQPRLSPPPLETFDTIGNTAFEFKSAQSLTPGVWVSGNLVNNFTDINGPSPIQAFGIVGCADVTAPFVCATANGGSVTLELNGEFTFTPKAGDAAASDSFQYQVWDGMDPSAARTVTINRRERVWYVRNNATAGGLGRSTDPFDTLAEAQTASSANDYIFVYLGDGTTTGQAAGITLKAGQHLLGEHAGLLIRFSPAITFNGAPGTTSWSLHAGDPDPAKRPLIDNPGGNAVSATDVIPAEISGLSLSGNVNAIDITHNVAFAGSGALEIRNNTVRSAGAEGIDINKGGSGSLELSLHDNTVTATGNGIDILRSNGGLAVTAFDDNAISGLTGGQGIVVTGPMTFDSNTANSVNDTVQGGATVIGASGNGVGSNGLVLSNVDGDLQFTDLDIYTEAGAGLVVSGTGALTASTGSRVTVLPGVSTFDANGGPAVSINNASVSLPLGFLRSLSSTTTGISLVNAFGGVGSTAFSVSSGQISDPSPGASGAAVNISGGNGNITLGIPITNNSGNAVAITGRTSDTVSFSGAIAETGSGISLTSNTGATINFTGAITASTGANPAFTATGGGTVTATDTTSTLATTTGTALNVSSTTIGASGLKFRSIASNGAASGIVLNSTGSSGGLTVSGNGGTCTIATPTCTGGTIQNSSGAGINLTSTASPSLSLMRVTGGGDDGIRGSSVTGFTLANSLVTNNGNALGEHGLDFSGLTGSASITSSVISGSFNSNASIRNSSGTLTMLTVTGSTFSNNVSTSDGDGVLFEASGTANMSINVSNSTFSAHQGDHFQAAALNSGVLNVVFSNNTLTGGHAAPLGQGITINAATGVPGFAGSVTYDINANSINGAISNAIMANLGTSAAGGTFAGQIRNNTIGTSGSALSCSTQANGINVEAHGNGTHTVSVTGNTIRRCFDRGINVLANDGNGVLNLTATNNTVTEMSDTNGVTGTPREAFILQAGATTTNVFGQIDSHAVCMNLSGPSGSLVGGAFKNGDIRTRQRFRTSVRMPGYAGTPFDTTAVIAFIQGNNPGSVATATAQDDAGVTTDGYFGGAACPLP